MDCFPGGSVSKDSACNVRDPGFNPGLERSLEKGMAATQSSFLAWRIPWTEESGGLESMGLQRVGHDWATNTYTFFSLGSWWQGKGEKRARGEQRALTNDNPGEGSAMKFEVLKAKWKCGAPCSKQVLALSRMWQQGTEPSLEPLVVWVLMRLHNSHTQEAGPSWREALGPWTRRFQENVEHRSLIRHWPNELFLCLSFSWLENSSLENERLGSYQTKVSDHWLTFPCINITNTKTGRKVEDKLRDKYLLLYASIQSSSSVPAWEGIYNFTFIAHKEKLNFRILWIIHFNQKDNLGFF